MLIIYIKLENKMFNLNILNIQLSNYKLIENNNFQQSLSQSATPSEVFTLHWALNGKSYSLLQNNGM